MLNDFDGGEWIADVLCREERWKSEGIQVGGIRSSRGVLGHWFDKYVRFLSLLLRIPLLSHMETIIPNSNRDHDQHGPAGPTAFWKVSNEIDDSPGDESGDADDEEDDADYEEGDDEGDLNVEDLNVEQIVAVLGAIAGAGT